MTEEFKAFQTDIETFLTDISGDVTKVRQTFEDWCGQLERPQIDGEAMRDKLSDVSNLLDDVYNELRGLN